MVETYLQFCAGMGAFVVLALLTDYTRRLLDFLAKCRKWDDLPKIPGVRRSRLLHMQYNRRRNRNLAVFVGGCLGLVVQTVLFWVYVPWSVFIGWCFITSPAVVFHVYDSEEYRTLTRMFKQWISVPDPVVLDDPDD